MKIQINATGKIVDMPLNIAQRMINKGIAHIVKEEVKPIWKPAIKVESKIGNTILSPLHEILPEITEENVDELKISKPKRKRSKRKITDEDNS